MKRFLACAGLAVALALPASLLAQATPNNRYTLNHVELGVYGDLFRVPPIRSNTVNFLGLGGRVGFSVHPNVQLEAEMNYDFERNYTTTVTTGSGTTTTSTTVTSNLRPLTGLFGPKFQVGTSGPVRAFVTAKGGFIQFTYSNNVASGSSFASSFNEFGNNSTHFAAYPGGGVELFAGPLGLRLEAGDEIWVDNGAHNNLRVTFGPTLRF
jgi:opacity protein-like surface antigen